MASSVSPYFQGKLLNLRKQVMSRRGQKVFLACCVSLTLLGFYISYLEIATTDIRLRSRRRICPIRHNVDTCIHHGTNMADLFNLCGNTTTPVCNFQDQKYELIVTNMDSVELVSDHTNKMVVLGEDIGKQLDQFVQTRSRWMIDPLGGSGYELLVSSTDSDRLSLQKQLDQLQHRCSNFFYGVISLNGFGSHWHTLGLALAHTLQYNMTLFTTKNYNNFIPMTTCTQTDLERAFSTHAPETDFSKWDKSTINFKSLGGEAGDVHALMHNNEIISPEFQHKGYLWWRSMLTYYAIRPNFKTREVIRRSSVVTTPCISIHVRHSDKREEAPPIDLSVYMEHAYKFREQTGISNIYLMSDDQKVIDGSRDYPDFQFHYMNVPRSNRGWINDKNDGVSMDYMEKNFLTDIFSAAQCRHMVVTYSSNVGRLMAEIAYAIHDEEPTVVSLDEQWKMHP